MTDKNIVVSLTKIENLIKKYKPSLKKSSMNFYISNIKKINSAVFSNKEDSDNISILDFLKFNVIKKYMETNINSISSKKNIISSILVLFGSLKEEYEKSLSSSEIEKFQEYHKELAKQREENYLDNIMSEKEEKNWISIKEIGDKIKLLRETIDEKNKNIDRVFIDTFQRYLILNLYTLLPPLRNDYALVKIVDDKSFGTSDENDSCIDNGYNYINMATKKLLLCTYKTKKFYGIKKIDIPDELFKIIKQWEGYKKKFFKENNIDFLLINTTKITGMKTNSLTKYLNKIFYPKKISSTMLRKVYLSEKYPVTVSYRDQAHDAMVMGHSLSMQKMVYSKKLK